MNEVTVVQMQSSIGNNNNQPQRSSVIQK